MLDLICTSAQVRAALLARVALALALLLALAHGASAQDEKSPMSDDEAALRQQYQNFDRLLVERDLDGVVALMTPDVTFENGRKKIKLVDWRRSFDVQVKSLVSCKTRVERVTFKNAKSAEVQTWSEQRYTQVLADGGGKKRFIIRSGAIDLWVKASGGWRLKSSEQQALDVESID